MPTSLDPTIVRDGPMTHADNGEVQATLLDGAGRVFKRNAIKSAGTPAAHQVTWLVVELDGVRVYINGSKVVVSKLDLYP